jgi:hypothetical protein
MRSRVGGGAYSDEHAGLRPPLKLHVQFSLHTFMDSPASADCNPAMEVGKNIGQSIPDQLSIARGEE